MRAPRGPGGTSVYRSGRLGVVELRARLAPAACTERLEALVDQRGPLAVRFSPRSRPALVGRVRPDGASLRLQTTVDNVADHRLELRWEAAGRGATVHAAFVPFAWVSIAAAGWCLLLAGALGLALVTGPLLSEATIVVAVLVVLTVLAWRLGRSLARRNEGLLLGAVVAALEARPTPSDPTTAAGHR